MATKQKVSKKTTCPVTKDQFKQSAKPLLVTISGESKVASVKEFSTGSFGFNCTDKIVIMVGDVPVTFQLGLNLTAIGSKPE